MAIYVDHTHLGRHVTGLERITLELFSPAALAPLDIERCAAETYRLPRRTQRTDDIVSDGNLATSQPHPKEPAQQVHLV
jgi:hypothetical protein